MTDNPYQSPRLVSELAQVAPSQRRSLPLRIAIMVACLLAGDALGITIVSMLVAAHLLVATDIVCYAVLLVCLLAPGVAAGARNGLPLGFSFWLPILLIALAKYSEPSISMARSSRTGWEEWSFFVAVAIFICAAAIVAVVVQLMMRRVDVAFGFEEK